METQSRISKYQYVGELSQYQADRKKTFTSYQQDKYSSYQNYLYKRALYGVSSLSNEELETICKKKLERIKRVHMKAQKVINLYKQKLTIEYTNSFFKVLFPESPLVDFFMNNTETDEKFTNKLTFKDLNISKDDIIRIFIEEGVLPKNFMEISDNPNRLPRLKNETKAQTV